MVNSNTQRTSLLIVGLLCAGVVGLSGCGSSTAVPSATTGLSAASASPGAPAASAATSPAATPSPTPAVAAVCAPTPIKFDPKTVDLTGAWAGDDGGIYYVRQRGNVIWWNGMSARDGPPQELGREWNNVGRGEIQKDLTIVSDWVDLPRGGIDGYGTLNLKIGADSAGNLQVTKTSETGTGRGDSMWTRCTPGFR